jgi:hypothetical protein
VAAAALVLGLIALAGAIRNTSGGGKTVEMSLLDPKTAAGVTKVRLVDAGGVTVEAEKQGGASGGEDWVIVTQNGVTLPAGVGKIDPLLREITKKRALKSLFGTPEEQKSLGFGQKPAARLEFWGDNGLLLTLRFGNPDVTGRRIALMRSNDSRIYQCNNDFAPWLDSRPPAWGDMALLPASVIKSEGDIQGARITGPLSEGETIVRSGHDDRYFHVLHSLRGAAVIAASVAERGEPAGKIIVESGTGISVTLETYGLPSGNYAVVPHVESGPATPREKRDSWGLFNYALEISPWSYEKLKFGTVSARDKE